MAGKTLRIKKLADEQVHLTESEVANLTKEQPSDSQEIFEDRPGGGGGVLNQNPEGIADGREVLGTGGVREPGKETVSVDKAISSVDNQIPSPDYLNVITQMLLQGRAGRKRDKEETEQKSGNSKAG
jgi:hypothetical protein